MNLRVERATGTSVTIKKTPEGMQTHYTALNLNRETLVKGVAFDLDLYPS